MGDSWQRIWSGRATGAPSPPLDGLGTPVWRAAAFFLYDVTCVFVLFIGDILLGVLLGWISHLLARCLRGIIFTEYYREVAMRPFHGRYIAIPLLRHVDIRCQVI